MQRVTSLLPLWDKAKPADGSSAAPAPAPASAASGSSNYNHRSSTSSNASAGNSTSFSFGTNRNSQQSIGGSSMLARPSRPLNKVFGWADRARANKSLTVSPSIANAGAARPAAAAPIGREAYWPTTLDRECEKAARILKSFCTDGFLDADAPAVGSGGADPTPASPASRASITSLASPRFSSLSASAAASASSRSAYPTRSPTTALASAKKKIPPRIIQDAVGLAIFSCMRSGLWMSGSGGSGILIARKADGTWSPPSGILLHTASVAFVLGVDIYDCVLVINSVAALELFTRPRLALGIDVPLAVGPLVTMGLLENDASAANHELDSTVLTYLKARGRHSPAQLAGSFVTERSNENERFYADDASAGSGSGPRPVDILDILAGNVRKSIPEILPLFEAIKAAEGRIDFDAVTMDRLSQQPAPGDADIADTPALLSPTSPSSTTFGIPDASDPDPFGIIALEMAGLEIREAGSKHRPSSHQFDYANASPTSPLFASSQRLSRQSSTADAAPETSGGGGGSGNRASLMSTRTQATSMTDACTQTDVAGTPDTSLSPSLSDDGKDARAAAVFRSAPLAVPALAVQAAPSEPETGAVLDSTGVDAVTTTTTSTRDGSPPPRLPPRSPRHSKLASAEKARASSTASPSAGHGAEASLGLVSDGGEDAASSSPYVEDERDGDADDEDEETDGLGGDEVDEVDEVLDDGDDDLDGIDIDDEEEPVVYEVATTVSRPVRAVPVQAAAQVIQAKGALVTISKRAPPPLPIRSPARTSRASKSEYGDLSMIGSPVRRSVQSNPEVGYEAGSQRAESPLALDDAVAPAAVERTSTPADESAADLTAVEKTTFGDDDPRAPSTPHATERTASSIDDSDREPQTPRPEDVLRSANHNVVGHPHDDSAAAPHKRSQGTPDWDAERLGPSALPVS